MTKLCRTLSHLVWRFIRRENGSVAMPFVLVFLPMTLSVGAAVDYSYAARSKSKLDAVADAAVISAVNHTAMATAAGVAQTAAQDTFNAMATGMTGVTITSAKATVTDNGLSRLAVVDYTATAPTVVMGMIGMKTMTLSLQRLTNYEIGCRRARADYRRPSGVVTSRMPSPIMLIAMIRKKMARPGMTMRCGLKNIMLRPSEIMMPQDGVGGGTPNPRNDNAASIETRIATSRLMTTMI
jgi:Flp pilus assembly protein TadG